MSKQPEALRLADALMMGSAMLPEIDLPEAAAELRRLHQSETEGWRYAREVEQDRQRLTAQHEELLAEINELLVALQLAHRLCKEALPKFNWNASALDANAIALLNSAPSKIKAAIAKVTKEQA